MKVVTQTTKRVQSKYIADAESKLYAHSASTVTLISASVDRNKEVFVTLTLEELLIALDAINSRLAEIKAQEDMHNVLRGTTAPLVISTQPLV